MSSKFVFQDCVYGKCALPPVCGRVVASRAFQRLRFISQMGPVQWVHHTATHTRFEHSLGVATLTYVWTDRLCKRHPTLMSDIDVLCLTLAGLLHDVGQGPWSHVYTQFVVRNGYPDWTPQLQSTVVAYHILSDPVVWDACMSLGLTLWHIKFIQELILGSPANAPAGWEWQGHPRGYLFEFVCNTTTGVDTVKLDSLVRDTHHLGINTKLDLDKLLTSTDLIFHEDTGTLRVAFSLGMQNVIRSVFSVNKTIQLVYASLDVCAISVMAMHAWVNVPDFLEGMRSLNGFLALSDFTLQSNIHLYFFNDDLVSRRFPVMTGQTRSPSPSRGPSGRARAGARAGAGANPDEEEYMSPLIARESDLQPPSFFPSPLTCLPYPPNEVMVRTFQINA